MGMVLKTELTDTFGGEANYSWVQRDVVELPEDASTRIIMRRAKGAALLAGVRGRWEDYGDQLTFRPYGRCVVLFVNVFAKQDG